MRARILLILASLALLVVNASAYCGSYSCTSYATPYGYYYERYTPYDYYSVERWDGYTNWEYVAPDGRFYSYYGPSYYGYYPYYYYSTYYYYPPAVYYHAPYYAYYNYGMYYYSPGFSIGARW